MAERRQQADITYPFRGLSETFSYSDQPPATSRDERNMRAFDPVTGRMRGAQRAGLGNHTGAAPANDFYKIQDINYVQREITGLDWSVATTPLVRGRQTFDKVSDLSHCVDIHRDLFGSFWCLSESGQVLQVNGDGFVVTKHDIAVNEVAPFLARRIIVDDFGNFFVSSGQEPDHNTSDNNLAWVKAYELLDDGSYKLAWTLYPGFHVLDMAIYGADLFLWGVYYDKSHHNATKLRLRRYVEYEFGEVPTTDSESDYDRDYEDVNWGFGGTGGAAVTFTTSNAFENALFTSETAHFIGEMTPTDQGDMLVTWGCWAQRVAVAGPPAVPANYQQIWGGLGRLRPISTNADAPQQWYVNATSAGMGGAVKVGPTCEDGAATIWSYGGGAGAAQVRLFKDTGTSELQENTFSMGSNSVGWSIRTGSASGQETGPDHWIGRGSTDEYATLYVPFHGQDDANAAGVGTYDGYSLIAIKATESSGTWTISEVDKWTGSELGIGSIGNRCVQVPLVLPDYNGASIGIQNTAIVGGDENDSASLDNSCALAELANASVDGTLALREIRNLVACGGKFFRYSSSGFTLINDPDGAAITYNATTNYVQSTAIRGQLFFADGVHYYVYDPAEDHIQRLQAEGIGAVPPRCRLIQAWRNRVVLARSDEAPGAWHMSRSGDPYDWNTFPTTPDTSQPHSGTTSRAGQCPDSINAIVPFSDDTLWFGCDSSIWQMSGDPANDAVFDLVSDEIGMSFGRPYCKDDTGALWFFGSKGGLYTTYETQISRGRQLLREVSQGAVRRRLENVDLSRYYVRLAYNYADDGVHVFVMPFANPGVLVDHFFYDKRTQSFHVDRFGTRPTDLIQPTAVLMVDGDSPSDRAIMIGGADGRVRRWGKDGNGQVPKSDEFDGLGTSDKPIDSYVLIGPLAPVKDSSATAVAELTAILAPTHNGCDYELFSTDTPDRLGSADYSNSLQAGRNATQLPRVSGDSIYLRLRNSRKDERWAWEKGTVMLSFGGGIRR